MKFEMNISLYKIWGKPDETWGQHKSYENLVESQVNIYLKKFEVTINLKKFWRNKKWT